MRQQETLTTPVLHLAAGLICPEATCNERPSTPTCLPCSLDYLKQECSQSKVFVLPAFETAPLGSTEEAHALARTAAAQSKEGLQKMVEKQQLWQFALKIFKAVRAGLG